MNRSAPVTQPHPHANDLPCKPTGCVCFLRVESHVCWHNVYALVFTWKMSQHRFKVSKANADGAENTKETFRRVNLSTDIEVNIIEPCKDFFLLLHKERVQTDWMTTCVILTFQFFFTLHWFWLIFLQPLPFNWTLQLFREPKSSKGNLDTYQSNLMFYRTQTKRAYLIFHSQPPREKRRRNQAFWPERPEI